MGFQMRVCPGSIGCVVVEEIAGMMYFFSLNHYIIVTSHYRCAARTLGDWAKHPRLAHSSSLLTLQVLCVI